jgi:hypothetical protein
MSSLYFELDVFCCFKDCRTSFSWAKVAKLKRSKIDQGLLMVMKIVIKCNKTAGLRGKRQKMPEICGDTVGDGLKGSSCYLLAGDPVGNAPIGSPFSFEHFSKCISHSVSLEGKVSNTLRAFPKESPIPLRYS